MSNSLLAEEQPVPCQNTQGATVPTGMPAAADSVLACLPACLPCQHPETCGDLQHQGAPAAPAEEQKKQREEASSACRLQDPLSMRCNKDSAGLPPAGPPHHLQEEKGCCSGQDVCKGNDFRLTLYAFQSVQRAKA